MKGDFGQECYRSSCENGNARYWHFSNRTYYCEECARELNEANRADAMALYGHDLLILDAKHSLCGIHGADKQANYDRLFEELKNGNAILFWKTMEGGRHLKYGPFSNFSRHSIVEDGIEYRTSEHYFQANKFKYLSKDYMDVVESGTPKDAANTGRDRSRPIKANWEAIKADVMLHTVKLKFDQHPDLKELLLGTGEKAIFEDSPIDWVWGIGSDRTGENYLGRLLMILRDHYRGKKSEDTLASFEHEYFPQRG